MGKDAEPEKSLSELSRDALEQYASELGLDVPKRCPKADLLRVIRQRRELLLELDREALLDIVVWARIPVRKSASKESLAKLIATIETTRYEGLSHRGLEALARLRGLNVSGNEQDETLRKRLRRSAGVLGGLRAKRRELVQWAIDKAISDGDEEPEEYQFLPEDEEAAGIPTRSLGQPQGVVGSIAGRLRNVADDYIAEKLDEIERRIDEKLDEIDARLNEWRDREVANRLRIIKITLVASVVVALLSLGYKYISTRVATESPATQPAAGVLRDSRLCEGRRVTKRPVADRGVRSDLNSSLRRLVGPVWTIRSLEPCPYASDPFRA